MDRWIGRSSLRYGEVERHFCLFYFKRADLPTPLLSLYLACCVPEYGEGAYTACMSCHVNLTPGVWTLKIKNLAYGQHSHTLLYVYESGVPILYHESKSIPWVLSMP